MEVAMGAMSALLPKLGELLSEEYNLKKSAKQDLRYLQRELQSMNAALSAVAEVARDELPVQDRLWADDIRELSQDI
jgi:disease resistance protein RPM1